MGGSEPLDIAAGAILALTLLRGLWLGMIREVFSLAALCAAYLAAVSFNLPLAVWLGAESAGKIGADVAPWVAGALLALGAITSVAIVGRLVQRGLRAAGLSWADRLGGSVLGLAEGAVAVGVLLAMTIAFAGRDHQLVAETRALATFERLEQFANRDGERLSDVAAPPAQRR